MASQVADVSPVGSAEPAPAAKNPRFQAVAQASDRASGWGPVALLQMAIGAAAAVAGIVSLLASAAPSGIPAPRLSSVPPRMEASSAEFEMVTVAENGQLVIYLTEYIGNEPIVNAALSVTVNDREAAVVERGGGVYATTDAGLSGPAQIPIAVTIDANGRQDLLGGVLDLPGAAPAEPSRGSSIFGLPYGAWLLAVGMFVLGLGARGRRGALAGAITGLLLASGTPVAAHPGHGDDDAAVSREDLDSSSLPPNSPRRLSDGSLFVPKQAQFVLGIRTALSRQGEANRTVRMVGRVVGDPAASGTVQSTMAGRVELTPGGLPRVGQRVVRGQVLATIAPVSNALDRGNVQQQLALIDGEIAALRVRAAAAASGNGNGRSDGKATEASAADIETLLRRRASINRILVDREGMQIPLRASSDGVIAVANAIAGQIVEARTTLYEIVDPSRVWVEAAGYDPTLLGAIEGASAVTADGRTLPLGYIGHGPKLTQQAIPILFHVDEPTMLPIGTPVSVLIETRDRQAGIILPPAAVVRNAAGQTIVWQHSGAERFIPLLVRTEPVDGRSVVVLSGLPDNRRVVVVGADLLNQVR